MFKVYLRTKKIEGMASSNIKNKEFSFKIFNDYIQTHDIVYVDAIGIVIIREYMYHLKPSSKIIVA